MNEAARLPLISRLEQRLGETGALLLFLLPSTTLLAFAQFYPLWRSAILSFSDWSLARSPTPGPFVGFANYEKAFSDGVFIGSIEFTVLLACVSTLIQLTAGMGVALLTVGEDWKMRLSRTLVMLPMVVAPIAAGTMWRMMLSARVGPINKALAWFGVDGPNWLGNPHWAVASVILVDAWEWTPFVIVVFAAALASLPGEVMKAAAVDGATPFQTFRLVAWPMLVPVVALVAMFRVIDGLLTLDVVFTTTLGGPGFTTHTLSFWIYQQGLRYFNISYAAAMSWILLFACMAVASGFLLWRRRLTRWQGRARGQA